MKNTSSRREFMVHSGEAAAVTAALATLGGVHTSAAEKTEMIRLGIIGCGGMMTAHVNKLIDRQQPVSFGWLCDVDPQQLAKTAKRTDSFQAVAPRQTSRYEDVIADKNIDAVIIATPHHWHAPIALQALAEGKDAYIEKPISHVYDEGNQVVAAAEKYGRVVQHGSQMRSSPVTNQAAKLLADGIIGEVKVARAWTAELRTTIAPVDNSEAPEGVDYDRWLGPAPKHPFNRQRFHHSWRHVS